jgi:2-oxoglutarate dehydrogenase E2 component (dihydrolipoamide succinyltransferase)
MKIEIRVPSIGESVSEVTLSTWLVEDGAMVEMDDSLCEFESDKATLELPAEKGGVVTRVAKEGDDLKIGDLVAYIDTEAAAELSLPQKKSLHQRLSKPPQLPSLPKKLRTQHRIHLRQQKKYWTKRVCSPKKLKAQG